MTSNPVVIVGAGPTGLTTALLLARHGVASIVLERFVDKPRPPKAHLLNPRTLEIYAAAGLDVARMQAQATNPSDDRWCIYLRDLLSKEIGSTPYEWQDDSHTPLPRINLQQPRLEEILLDAADSEPLIEIRQGHRWLSATESQAAVTSIISIPETSTYELPSTYLLAADGANSVVREHLRFAMEGPLRDMRCLTVHFEGDLRHLVRDRPAMFYWPVRQNLPGIFIAYDIAQTWVYIWLDAPEETPNEREVLERLHRAIGTKDLDLDVRHVTPWSLMAQVAARFNTDRTFLLGDACHRFPPSGGLGLNTGIQDAHNLAWKLAAVLKGWADPELLGTYELERRPVALRNSLWSMQNSEAVSAMSAVTPTSDPQEIEAAIDGMFDNFNSIRMQIGFSYSEQPNDGPVSTYDPRADIGDRMPHAWIDSDKGRISTLVLLNDRTYTLLTRGADRDWQVPAGIPLTIVPLRSDWTIPAQWLDVMGLAVDDSAVLVRPDGHIEDRAQAGDPLRLSLTGKNLEVHTGNGVHDASGPFAATSG